MELRLLHTFVAVAELRHFARAADRCNLSQPAVSHQIRLLEEDVGVRLLNRDGRRVSLTVAGEALLEDARRILASVDRARERAVGFSSGTTGRVRLGASGSLGLYRLPALLERYRGAHPNFALHFEIGAELELLERVAANDLDMAVLAGRPVLGELQARRIGSDALVAVAPLSSPLVRGRARMTDLRNACWLLREEGSDTRRQFDAWARRHRFTPSRMMTLFGPDAVKRGVLAGLGVALLSRSVVAEDLEARRLAVVKGAPPLNARDVLLVDHPHKHHGPACRAMLQMLTPTVGEK